MTSAASSNDPPGKPLSMETMPDFELVAASLRADSTDLDVFVPALAAKLCAALPEQVEVERSGLLGRRPVRRVEVFVGEHRYELRYERKHVETSRARVVRGIVLKTEELPLDVWIDALSRDLAEEAGTSERSRLALQRLLDA
jgi:hypothetical protein